MPAAGEPDRFNSASSSTSSLPRLALAFLLAGLSFGQQEMRDPESLLRQGLKAYERKDLTLAISLWKRGLEVSAADKDDLFLGSFHGNLGIAYTALGEHARAIEHYQASLELARKGGDRQGQKNRLNNLAGLYLLARQPEKALEVLEEGLKIARDLRDPLLEVKMLSNAGQALLLLRRSPEASERFRLALEAAEAGWSELSERERGELKDALKRMQQAMVAQGLGEGAQEAAERIRRLR